MSPLLTTALGVAWACDDVSRDTGEICETGVPAGDAEIDEPDTVADAIGDAVTNGLETGAGPADDVTSFGREDAVASRDCEPAS